MSAAACGSDDDTDDPSEIETPTDTGMLDTIPMDTGMVDTTGG